MLLFLLQRFIRIELLAVIDGTSQNLADSLDVMLGRQTGMISCHEVNLYLTNAEGSTTISGLGGLTVELASHAQMLL